MDFTVIVPAFNEERNIRSCLESIIATGYPPSDYEVIVVDDGSTDMTAEIVKEYALKSPNIRCISKENAGKASAQNAGLKAAKGRFILITDADSMVDSKWFVNMRKALEKADMVQGACYAKETKNLWQKIQYAKELVRLKHFNSKAVIGVGANNGFRKDAAIAAGGFNENTANVTTDFIYRLKKKGYSVDYRPEILVYTLEPDTFLGFLRQRLRWLELDYKKAGDWGSVVYLLQVLYNQGFSAIVFVSVLAFALTLNTIFLFPLPLGVLLDFIVFSKSIKRMFLSEDRRWLTYYLLYSVILNFVIRPLLMPYLAYRFIRPRKKPTFKK